mgnify:CR=1 FL=1|tara:strand:+ start:262 stop:1056 length:795 start_codon:yes stop_codon:yes gene_type:complete
MRSLIITDGCSFTNWNETWATLLKDTNDLPLINYGKKGNSNDNIVGKFSEKFERTLSSENFDNYYIIIQLTGLDRKMINGSISPSIGKIFGDDGWKSQIFNLFGMKNADDGDGGYDWKSYFENEYTPEKHINDLLINVINLQSYFRSLSNTECVKYKFILGWDIFTMADNDQWSNTDRHINIDSKLIKDQFESSKKYWDEIDWDSFWFFENEKVKYGGITQWTQYNCEKHSWYRSWDDKHPSYEAHKNFKEKVVELIIEDMKKK